MKTRPIVSGVNYKGSLDGVNMVRGLDGTFSARLPSVAGQLTFSSGQRIRVSGELNVICSMNSPTDPAFDPQGIRGMAFTYFYLPVPVTGGDPELLKFTSQIGRGISSTIYQGTPVNGAMPGIVDGIASSQVTGNLAGTSSAHYIRDGWGGTWLSVRTVFSAALG